MIRFSIRIRDR